MPYGQAPFTSKWLTAWAGGASPVLKMPSPERQAWVVRRYQERVNEACATRTWDDERMSYEAWRTVYHEMIYGAAELAPDEGREQTVAERLNAHHWTVEQPDG